MTATPALAEQIEQVLVGGDISKLKTEDRLAYYNRVCESLGLNPLTKPFEYLTLQGKTTLYAKKDATDQLRAINKVSIRIVSREVTDGVYVVTARAIRPDGREDESIGALPLPASPVDRANAIMKCETKAKRRATLSICGLGWLDETEIETIGSRAAQADALNDELAKLGAAKVHQLAAPANQADARTSPELMKAFATLLPDDPPKGLNDYEQRETAKTAEAQKIVEDAKPSKPARTGAISFENLKAWGELKADLIALSGTSQSYYGSLKAKGYGHANEIKTKADATIIWRVLCAERTRLREAQEARKALMMAREVLGISAFGEIIQPRIFGIEGDAIEAALSLPGDQYAKLAAALKTAVDAKNAQRVDPAKVERLKSLRMQAKTGELFYGAIGHHGCETLEEAASSNSYEVIVQELVDGIWAKERA